ncbi:hypothetical protein C8J57DRAFT_1255387 [Mycena rebaudengoi]|nr:hypothetical protein C8J57DRAFT_1255387 [Mycena rebaudengoi]
MSPPPRMPTKPRNRPSLLLGCSRLAAARIACFYPVARVATITTQYPHLAPAASGPLTTGNGTRSPPPSNHTPSSVSLGKRCLVEILFDEADPVASTSFKVCVLSDVQIPNTLEENLITTSTLNLWYDLSGVCSEAPSQAPNCDDRVAVSCNDIRKFCRLFQYLDLPRLAAIIECRRITGTSNTKASKELGISLHECSHTCPGYSSVLVFKRIIRKRRSVHASDDTESAKIVSTEKEADANMLSCPCDDTAAFVAHYTQLSMAELNSIAHVHLVGDVPKKPAMRQELIRHSCGDECPGQGNRLLFSRIPRKRNGPFKVIERSSLPADAMGVDGPTIESMDNLRIMPVAFTNDIVVDIEDGTHFCSAYLLNKNFEFAEIVTDMHTSSLAKLVSYFSHFSVEHLTARATSQCHGVTVPRSKPLLEEYILEHQCDVLCPGHSQTLLFKRIRKHRNGLFLPRSVQTIRDRERARKLTFNANSAKRKSVGAPTGQTVKQAARAALTAAEKEFPYIATASDRYGTAVEWQDTMHPPRWLPIPCAIGPGKQLLKCAHRAKKTLAEVRQPVDLMANFQYYARDELPPDVKAAFDGASMYDIMMVAKSRATRITHLFKKNKKTSNPGSQGYSQSNVAIFAQDVEAVRTVLPLV